MLIMSYMGDQVWLMTSKHTLPDLKRGWDVSWEGSCGCFRRPYNSSMFGWKMRFTKPMLGLLYGYWSGSSTWIFHRPPAKGATRI